MDLSQLIGPKNADISDQLEHFAARIGAQIEPPTEILEKISGQLEQISRQLAEAAPRPTLRRLISFDAGINPHRIQTRGYRHNRIRVLAAVTLTVVSDPIAPAAGYTLALVAGWNTLDLPNDALISTTTATVAELEYTDHTSN